jgi:CubicO group peptidase (beta-lactamase class C family)
VRNLLITLSVFISVHAGAQTPEDVWPEADWQRATPEQMGMDSRALATLVEYGGNARMDSLVVTRHGRIVTEVYYAPFQRGMKHRINSATKGVVAALAGIASAQGLLGSTDTPLSAYFPERPAAFADAGKQKITLQSLLDMTSGLDWFEPLTDEYPRTLFEWQRSRNWAEFVLDRPMAQAPGAAFNYNSGNTHLVSAIIARKSGMRTDEFAAKHLFAPLGITDFRWLRDPQGISTGGYGLYLQTPDMARIGLLYLHHGQWKGAQVVPRDWVGKVYRASVPMNPGGTWRYGDSWWTMPSRKAYMAVGFQRQIIMVLPEVGVVAAMTGHATNYPIENVIDHLLRAARSPQALPGDAQGLAALQARIDEVATEKPATPIAPAPAMALSISGRTLRLANDGFGWKEVTLHLGAASAYDVLLCANRGCTQTRKVTRPLGVDGHFALSKSEPAAVASKMRWTGENSLNLAIRVPEEGPTLSYDVIISGNRADVTQTDDFGARRTIQGELLP